MRIIGSTAIVALLLLPFGCDAEPGEAASADRQPLGKADALGSCVSDTGPDDHCGGQSSGSCWCDSLCSDYGDCCADKVEVCDAPPEAMTCTEHEECGADYCILGRCSSVEDRSIPNQTGTLDALASAWTNAGLVLYPQWKTTGAHPQLRPLRMLESPMTGFEPVEVTHSGTFIKPLVGPDGAAHLLWRASSSKSASVDGQSCTLPIFQERIMTLDAVVDAQGAAHMLASTYYQTSGGGNIYKLVYCRAGGTWQTVSTLSGTGQLAIGLAPSGQPDLYWRDAHGLKRFRKNLDSWKSEKIFTPYSLHEGGLWVGSDGDTTHVFIGSKTFEIDLSTPVVHLEYLELGASGIVRQEDVDLGYGSVFGTGVLGPDGTPHAFIVKRKTGTGARPLDVLRVEPEVLTMGEVAQMPYSPFNQRASFSIGDDGTLYVARGGYNQPFSLRVIRPN